MVRQSALQLDQIVVDTFELESRVTPVGCCSLFL